MPLLQRERGGVAVRQLHELGAAAVQVEALLAHLLPADVGERRELAAQIVEARVDLGRALARALDDADRDRNLGVRDRGGDDDQGDERRGEERAEHVDSMAATGRSC